MGSSNRNGRNQQMFIEDFPNAKVHPLNCVPDERPKGSWTNGVLAWQKSTSSENAKIVGWFTPPRFRKGKSKDRGSYRFLESNFGEEQ